MRARSLPELVKRLLLSGACRKKRKSVSQSVASRGHFIVYTADQKRYMVPITYLKNETFRVMLERSEEEFGLPGSGPIMLPCDAYFMEHLMFLIGRTATELEKVILLCS